MQNEGHVTLHISPHKEAGWSADCKYSVGQDGCVGQRLSLVSSTREVTVLM